jgi:integrase
MRKMEALHMRWSDVDFEGRSIRVTERRGGSFEHGGKTYPVFAWTTKAKGSARTIPVTDDARLALQRAKLANDGSAYVFLTLARLEQVRHRANDAGELPPSFDLVPNVLRDFQAIQRAAQNLLTNGSERPNGPAEHDSRKWPEGTIHDLRKSWCTRLASVLPMHVLREYAGHADIATTAKYYLRTTADDAAKLRRALASVA